MLSHKVNENYESHEIRMWERYLQKSFQIAFLSLRFF